MASKRNRHLASECAEDGGEAAIDAATYRERVARQDAAARRYRELKERLLAARAGEPRES